MPAPAQLEARHTDPPLDWSVAPTAQLLVLVCGRARGADFEISEVSVLRGVAEAESEEAWQSAIKRW